MSVMLVTSLGDIVVDLFADRCPLTCKNFLKLCKIKYYNGCLFHTVQKDFTAQTGDPTGTGSGGDSVYKFLYGDQARFFGDEIHLDLKHTKTGTVAMASAGENLNASQFYITLRDDLDYLDGKHTVFGEVAEGFETLTRINEAFVDEHNRPYKNIRIKHTYVLDDPFDDPPLLTELIPDTSPEGRPKDEVVDDVRLEDDWVPMDEQLGHEELEEILREKAAHSSAVVLESVGDIPDAEIKPPDNVLFVCKLNPVTEDEDLHTIFSRFGIVTSAEVIRDYKTGDSLCYAFIEFEDKEACEQAYFKMDNALIDDRRIHVDFSQSVAKLWSQFRRKGQKGGGCFKCGSVDHVAKDCPGDPASRHQGTKYILKETNVQRGADNSRYEMVFGEVDTESPRRSKRPRGEEYEIEKRRIVKRDDAHDLKDRGDPKKRDLHDRSLHRERSDNSRKFDDGSRRDRRDETQHDKRHGDDVDRRDKRDDREHERRRERDDFGHGDKREGKEYGKTRQDDIGRKDGRDSRKQSIDDDIRRSHRDHSGLRDSRRDSRSESYTRRMSDGDSRKGRVEEKERESKRDDRDDSYSQRMREIDGRRGRGEERDHEKRSLKSDEDRGRDRDRDRDRDRGRRH